MFGATSTVVRVLTCLTFIVSVVARKHYRKKYRCISNELWHKREAISCSDTAVIEAWAIWNSQTSSVSKIQSIHATNFKGILVCGIFNWRIRSCKLNFQPKLGCFVFSYSSMLLIKCNCIVYICLQLVSNRKVFIFHVFFYSFFFLLKWQTWPGLCKVQQQLKMSDWLDNWGTWMTSRCSLTLVIL